jgi:hypothetical protein
MNEIEIDIVNQWLSRFLTTEEFLKTIQEKYK